jgi:hypothetical protein
MTSTADPSSEGQIVRYHLSPIFMDESVARLGGSMNFGFRICLPAGEMPAPQGQTYPVCLVVQPSRLHMQARRLRHKDDDRRRWKPGAVSWRILHERANEKIARKLKEGICREE